MAFAINLRGASMKHVLVTRALLSSKCKRCYSHNVVHHETCSCNGCSSRRSVRGRKALLRIATNSELICAITSSIAEFSRTFLLEVPFLLGYPSRDWMTIGRELLSIGVCIVFARCNCSFTQIRGLSALAASSSSATDGATPDLAVERHLTLLGWVNRGSSECTDYSLRSSACVKG